MFFVPSPGSCKTEAQDKGYLLSCTTLVETSSGRNMLAQLITQILLHIMAVAINGSHVNGMWTSCLNSFSNWSSLIRITKALGTRKSGRNNNCIRRRKNLSTNSQELIITLLLYSKCIHGKKISAVLYSGVGDFAQYWEPFQREAGHKARTANTTDVQLQLNVHLQRTVSLYIKIGVFFFPNKPLNVFPAFYKYKQSHLSSSYKMLKADTSPQHQYWSRGL